MIRETRNPGLCQQFLRRLQGWAPGRGSRKCQEGDHQCLVMLDCPTPCLSSSVCSCTTSTCAEGKSISDFKWKEIDV